MAVKNAMFVFEVLMQSMKTMVESRQLVVKADFADIFSLELKDPKRMNLVMPEPLPLPPEPAGKKAKKPKPKKKGKKGAVELPPPEPEIKAGQSILFSSSAEVLKQTMEREPVEFSLWNKEDGMEFVGSTHIQWDPIFLEYLQKILDCTEPPPVMLKEEYNIFQEGKGKLIAQIIVQITLSNLTEKVATSFRTLTEDDDVRKCLYTGINSKVTSFMCTYKTTDEVFEENNNNIYNCYTVDKEPPKASRKPIYANFKNAPGANLSGSEDKGEYCCAGNVDKAPDAKYKAPETCPSIDYIIDYVRQIIISCNDNMRMLTPQPTIKPRIKATDIDRLCYCKETDWPESEFAKRFKNAVQTEPCPLCIDALKKHTDKRGGTFDIANIRGPCGKPDCRIARDMRAYLEKLVEEDKVEFNLEEMIGPCGSKDCRVAEKILEFLRNEGVFTEGTTKEGLSTQCDCLTRMHNAIKTINSCADDCSKDCSSGSDASNCESEACPFNVYNVYYFTVELDDPPSHGPKGHSDTSASSKAAKHTDSAETSSTYKYCAPTCPTASSHKPICSKSSCMFKPFLTHDSTKCIHPICPSNLKDSNSPADSNLELDFDDIVNPCCVKSCDLAEKIKDIIVDGQQKKKIVDDKCYCDCVCDVHFDNTTTYCAVCGGFESLGTDMKDMPEFMKPHPCPVYHKLYDKKYIKVTSPWPEESKPTADVKKEDKGQQKSWKTPSIEGGKFKSMEKEAENVSQKEKKSLKKETEKKAKKTKEKEKNTSKSTLSTSVTGNKGVSKQTVEGNVETQPSPYPYPAVPKNMGWMWNATDIPGMKPHHRQWRPGAVHKRLVRRYRMVREGVDVAKKKRAMLQKKKKLEMKPTLIVTKHEYGEYTVQFEVLKQYSKERLLHQYPYDEKPPLVYQVGKTDEERTEFKKQRDRRERRETRRKCRLLQSAFRDKCQEICLKAYNQAIGILPLPNPNNPDCPCVVKDKVLTPPIDSCSCSDAGTISSSDTDNDEWTIEFTPPLARWDPKAKHPPVLAEAETQYTYLDYRVKILDKSGNQIPRYFKGPDGKQQCSDLGGFWSKEKEWLEINKDGYIGPDGRWIPLSFTGPDGMVYSSDEGAFTDSKGRRLKIGVDGYIGEDNKWIWYNKRVDTKTRSNTSTAVPDRKKDMGKGDAKSKSDSPPPGRKAPSKSIDDVKKDSAKRSPPKVQIGGAKKGNNPLVMNVAVDYNRNMHRIPPVKTYYNNKPQIDDTRLDVYREIMEGLEPYRDVLGSLSPVKTNRASNTQSGRELNQRYGVMSPSTSRFSPCSMELSRQSSTYRPSPVTMPRKPMSTST